MSFLSRHFKKHLALKWVQSRVDCGRRC